ncbi:MAG: GIY-YIG nuclease family protein [Clostridiales bacterium]|nr:GIY-YIG nuclease family protein [Clostridiales bacterium]
MNEHVSYVYIMFNFRNGTLYTGVTNNLIRRVGEHKSKTVDGFTKKYEIDKLGYYEIYTDIKDAINREKQIKGGSRKAKLKLIETMNPNWEDLYNELVK